MKEKFLKMFLGAMILALGIAGPALAVEKYEFDPAHTTIGFAVKHLMVSTVRGNFSDYTGSLSYDKNDPSAFSAEATNLGASPARRGFSMAGIFFPVTFSHARMTSRTE